jgi:hypothetical protein
MKHKARTECPPDCPDRSAKCHETCEKYLAEWKQRRERNKENLENSKSWAYTTDTVYRVKNGRGNSLSRLRKGFKQQ